MARRKASSAVRYACAMSLCAIALCSSCRSTKQSKIVSMKQSKIVEPTRLSGILDIQPSAADIEQLTKSGKSRAVAVTKMCLDEAGNIKSVEFLEQSGLREWDSRIIEEMRKWKHTPFTKDGQPISACRSVTFVYKTNEH